MDEQDPTVDIIRMCRLVEAQWKNKDVDYVRKKIKKRSTHAPIGYHDAMATRNSEFVMAGISIGFDTDIEGFSLCERQALA